MWSPRKGATAGEKRRRKVALQKKNLGLTKRRRFVLVSLLLSVGLLVVQNLSPEERFLAFIVYFFISYGLSAWSLRSDLNGVEWLTNLILPAMFPVSVGLFYFLLPQQTITRLIVLVLFAIGMYALLLTANIFAVASIRTIQLLRAARAVGFLLTVLTSVFLFHLILSFRYGAFVTAMLVFAVSYPLILQGLWSSELETVLTKKIAKYSLVSSLILGQFGMTISFWPVEVAMGSIFLAMVLYVLLGVFQHLMEERLFRKTMQEYLGFGGIVFAIVVVSVLIRWSA